MCPASAVGLPDALFKSAGVVIDIDSLRRLRETASPIIGAWRPNLEGWRELGRRNAANRVASSKTSKTSWQVAVPTPFHRVSDRRLALI